MAYVVLEAGRMLVLDQLLASVAISQQNYGWRSSDNDNNCFDYRPALLCLHITPALQLDREPLPEGLRLRNSTCVLPKADR
jgi:hypothetical protein